MCDQSHENSQGNTYYLGTSSTKGGSAVTRWVGSRKELRARLIAQAQQQAADVWEALEQADNAPAGRRKFGNIPTVVDGIRFDSQAEARRYGELLILVRAGAITDLAVHPRYVLTDGPRPPVYVADFAYVEQGRQVVEDVKGGKATQTPAFRLKAKLFRERYPHIELRIIER